MQPTFADVKASDTFDHTRVLEWMSSHDIRQAILCGPPGSGKTGSLQRLIADSDVHVACWVLLNLKQFPPDWILTEIGEASLYRGADPEWAPSIRTLLRKFGARSSQENQGSYWQRLLDLLDTKAQWRNPDDGRT